MAIRWVGCVCGRRTENLCLLWRETQTKVLSSRSPTRPEIEEERKVPEKTESQLTKKDEERQSTTESRRDQSVWDSSSGEGRSAEGGSKGRQLAFLVAFVEVSRKIQARNSLQMHGECKVSQNPFLALGADPSPCLFVCSFSSTLSVVFYVAVKKCVIPLSETTEWITGHE